MKPVVEILVVLYLVMNTLKKPIFLLQLFQCFFVLNVPSCFGSIFDLTFQELFKFSLLVVNAPSHQNFF